MKKLRVTRKEMRENNYIFGIGYCEMYSLLQFNRPVAYSAGIYGWDCDYYIVDGVVISTSYRPIKNKNMKNSDKLVKEYEEKAIKISNSITMTWEQKKNRVDKLLSKLICKLKEI